MQSTTHCKTRNQYVEMQINAAEKKLNIMARRRLMITTMLQTRLMLNTSVGSREKKKSDQNLNPPLNWCRFYFLFFSLQVVNSRTWPWLCSLCGENWGNAVIRLREEHFSGSWTHILSRGGRKVDWLEGRHLSIFLAEDVRKLCVFARLNLWTLLGCIDIRMLHDGGSTGGRHGSQSIWLSSKNL